MLIIVASIFVSLKKKHKKKQTLQMIIKKTNIHKKLFIFLVDTIFKDESLPQIMNFSQRENLVLISVNYIKNVIGITYLDIIDFFKNIVFATK